MSFRKPITTLGGLILWRNIQQNTFFVMQQHKVGLPIWPYKYRIIMRENRMEIANSNDPTEIEHDWNYLKENAVPQIQHQIDIGKKLSEIDWVGLINTAINAACKLAK